MNLISYPNPIVALRKPKHALCSPMRSHNMKYYIVAGDPAPIVLWRLDQRGQVQRYSKAINQYFPAHATAEHLKEVLLYEEIGESQVIQHFPLALTS